MQPGAALAGFKGGVQFRERSERKSFWTPPFAYVGDMEEHCTAFTIAIMTSKRLPAASEST